MADLHTYLVTDPRSRASKRRERPDKSEEASSAFVVVDCKLARSRDSVCNDYLRRESNDVESRARRESKGRKSLTTTRTAGQMDQRDDTRDELVDKKRSVDLVKQQQQATETKRTYTRDDSHKVVKDTRHRYETTGFHLKNHSNNSFSKQPELLSQMLTTASEHEVCRLEELLTSVHIAEHTRDELQQQCDFVDTEMSLKQEEMEELLDRLEVGVYDAQRKETDIIQMEKTLEERQRQLLQVNQELTRRQAELADIRYVVELEESTFFQLLDKKDEMCRQVNEVAASLRQDLEVVEREIERQEEKMAVVKNVSSEMGNTECHTCVEYEHLSRQLNEVAVELTRRTTELDDVTIEVQRRHRDVNLLSTKQSCFATELFDVVCRLNGVVIAQTGQSLVDTPSADDIEGLSKACTACLTELQRIADWKNGEITNLHSLLSSRSSELSAADGLLREKQRKLAELQSSIASQETALQQLESESKLRHDEDELRVMQRRQELEGLEAKAAAVTLTVDDIERKAAQLECTRTIAEDELNKSITDLTAVRQELEEITRRNRTYTSLEGTVSKLSADCEMLRKDNLTLQNDLGEAIKEKRHMQYQYQKLYLSAKSEIHQIKGRLQESKFMVEKQGLGEPIANSTFVDDLETSVSSPQDLRDTKTYPNYNPVNGSQGRHLDNRETKKHAAELKSTSEELVRARSALATARHELAIIQQQKAARVAHEDDTFSTSRDYEKLRKEITVLRSHLDKVAREKNGAQYRYQTLLQQSKSEIQRLRSQLQDSTLFAEKQILSQPLASSTPFKVRPYSRTTFHNDESRSRVQRASQVIQNETQSGWRRVGQRPKSSIANIVDDLDTQTASHCSTMKSRLLQQLSSYEERCKSCCLEAEDFVATARNRMKDLGKPAYGVNWS